MFATKFPRNRWVKIELLPSDNRSSLTTSLLFLLEYRIRSAFGKFALASCLSSQKYQFIIDLYTLIKRTYCYYKSIKMSECV